MLPRERKPVTPVPDDVVLSPTTGGAELHLVPEAARALLGRGDGAAPEG